MWRLCLSPGMQIRDPRGDSVPIHRVVNIFTTLPWPGALSLKILHEDPTAHADNIHKMNMLSKALLYPLGRLKCISGYHHKGNAVLSGVVLTC